MSGLLQNVLAGLSAGSVHALLALGLVVVYKSGRLVNFAHGAIATLAAYLSHHLSARAGLPLGLALVVGIAVGAAVGAGTYLALVRRVERASSHAVVLVTLGLALVIQGVIGALWGADTKAFPHLFAEPTSWHLGGAVYASPHDAALIGSSATLGAVTAGGFRGTRLGLAVRAVACEPETAALLGLPTRRLVALSWGVASALGGVAALLTSPRIFLEPAMMFAPLFKAFAAAALGGMTSLGGAVLGGWILGVLETLVGAYVSTTLQPALAFAVLVLALVLRPRGLWPGPEATNEAR